MKARDIMTSNVVAVRPDAPIHSVAAQMTEKRISGVPVVNESGNLVGIISESDLMHRAELGTQRKRKWWLAIFSDPDQMARDFAKSHGLKAQDVMSTNVITVGEDADLREVANTFDSRNVKRLPVVRDGKLLGIITRSDLVRALARVETMPGAASVDDATIHSEISKRMSDAEWLNTLFMNAIVTNGVVELRGFIATNDQRRALRVLIEQIPGVRGIDDQLVLGIPTTAA
ncbi:CBS domain-containing protein [Leptospira interrogans]